MSQQQIRILTFNKDEHMDSIVYRLNKGYIIQFRPGPTLFGRKLNVYTNHPISSQEPFERLKYRHLPWKSDSPNKGDDTALFVEVPIRIAGSFHFYVTFNDCSDRSSATASGYFLVDPTLHVGDSTLPLDCIQCQTYMSKCIGPLDHWLDSLSVAREAGYNMIHFTPIQELGSSRSGYSIANQLKLNPEFSTGKKQYVMDDVKKIVDKMNKDWKVMSVTDIVLNHTTNESNWIKEHPDCVYNVHNSPHLRPAYIIDRAIYHLSLEIKDGKWEAEGIPATISTNEHVEALGRVLFGVFSRPKVEEFYMVDTQRCVEEFNKLAENSPPSDEKPQMPQLSIIQDPNFGRKTSTIDMNLALLHFNKACLESAEKDRIEKVCNEFRQFIDGLNEMKKNEICGHLQKAVGCILGTVRYERLQDDGPKIPSVSKKHPLAAPYFTHCGKDSSLVEEEKLSFGRNAAFLMAHNGWVMSDDPLSNFALPGCFVYLRRELVAWGDSVKLRYGEKPEDSPYLWKYMQKYVEKTAHIFSGIRLDNCHSTPIHVAEYLLDCARRIRPDLYVFAELFTSSEKTDNVFVNRLGINSLVREAMSAPDSHEEGRLVYRYGGEPVGAFKLPPVRPLVPSVAHAIFYELTHDNKSPCETRSAWDFLPSSAIVNMASCATGSNRGYDEIVPIHIHVVNEERKYARWSTKEEDPPRGFVNADSGIIQCKRLINDLHFYLGANGYTQVFVDQVTKHIVTITRHNPETHQSVVLVAYTSFDVPAHIHEDYIRPLKVQGKFEEIIFELSLRTEDQSDCQLKVPGNYAPDKDYINGINGFITDIKESIPPSHSSLVRQISLPGAETTELEYTPKFRPGSVIAFRLSLLPHAHEAVVKTRSILNDFHYLSRHSQVQTRNAELLAILKDISLPDLNRILYRCDEEEKDEGKGWGAYSIPNFGPFVYCGLQGLESALSKIRANNDLGHPICNNIRDGDWLMDYIMGRLKTNPATEKLGAWFESVFSSMKDIPRYLIPAYLDAFIAAIYLVLLNHGWQLLGKFVYNGSDFVKALGICSVQFCGVVLSALLPTLSPKLEPPRPPSSKGPKGSTIQMSVTLSAGLPHFSVGYMRNWGRDTFIALPGNLLITERYHEARWIILAFAQTLRHGLIPNLLDGGAKSRFNCRDSLWFWLYSIQQYVKMAPEGHKIFKDKVSRLFPDDDSRPLPPGTNDQLLECVIQEALKRHFQGVSFRERNAGFQIDSQMTSEGFNNCIGVDLDTGFPYGGNVHNCGTWMDKMGSSEKAGNKGKPATPRDGSAVEIVGLCKATLRFLNEMHKDGKYSFNSVERTDELGNGIEWTYSFWEEKIKENFEKHFWVNENPTEGESHPKLINRRGIYKDTLNASQQWGDYQLRCNFPIALAVAPELATPKNASSALQTAEKILLGPLGIKTLDPSDWSYRGNYDNSNDSADFNVANGFNYHQGPEWVWPVGWLFKAQLATASKLGQAELCNRISCIKSLLANHFGHLCSSHWRSLPELTNANGSFCPGSNPAQSWSTGCLLEVLWEMDKYESTLKL